MLEGVILAGGLGSRLRGVISDVPKPMAPIGHKPFLQILLDDLVRKKFERIVLAVGYKAEVISNYFGNNYDGMRLDYALEETPLGTGGATRLAMSLCSGDHVYVLNGDTFLDFDSETIEKDWKENQTNLILGRYIDNIDRYGELLICNEKIIGFEEKNSTKRPGIINAGCYIFSKNELEKYPLGFNFSIEKDYLFNAVKIKDFKIHLVDGLFIDIGIPEDYRRAELLLSLK